VPTLERENPEEENYLKWLAAGILVEPRSGEEGTSETDAVIGNNRLPLFGDRARLSYVDALMKEIY
jgi:hypothetical protein